MSRNCPSPVDQGRLALAAVLASLPDGVPGNAVERVMLGRSASARDALVALVTDAAFALCSAGRGLLEDAAASLLERSSAVSESAWPFGADTFAPAVRAALGALLTEHSEAAFASLEPEELGGLYEGLLATGLELARSDSVVVSEPRPAGGAAVDRLMPVAMLRPTVVRGRRRLAPPRLRVPAGRIALLDTVDRRRSGSHYTPRALAERVVRETLEPLLGDTPSVESVLALRVCDPAMGTGAFLVAVCRYLAERLLFAEHAAGVAQSAHEHADARRRVAEHCLFGVDRDARAVAVARQALWLVIGDATLPLTAFDASLCVGEALLGPPRDDAAQRTSTTPRPSRARQTPTTRRTESTHAALDWERAFAHVFAERGGFDAFVGNPPWVSYAGRAAQPLSAALHLEYARYEAFRGYRNLQGLFVERCARLLRPGGRLGLVLPSSMSELAGYRPTRRAHDRWCEPDETLADLGASAFDGVFQPCMVLRSTRRAAVLADVPERPWPVERPDLDAVAHALIEKLSRAPLPAHLFGERGLQSTGKDGAHLVAAPDARHSVPLRSGSDVEAFGLKNPSAHADPAWFGPRLRPAHEWERVRLLVRQTARVPVVALSDGVGFRNSLLAGFDDDEHPASFLVAYLNSTPIRWLHYARHRDARQGMPQLKVAHLRATPSPPSLALKNTLTAFGKELSLRGRGIRAREQLELDDLVENAFELDELERKRLAEFRASVADAKPRD
jgi:hypothetical protein